MKLRRRRIFPVLIAFLLPIIFQRSAFGGTFTAFGPRTFVRSTGDPVTETVTFSVLNPNTSYTLEI